MTSQLLLSKRLFLEGCKYSKAADAVSCGIAVSLFQDSAEMLVWALVKQKNLHVRDKFSFTGNLDELRKADVDIREAARMLEVNNARVSFKHYGIAPSVTEAAKFLTHTEVFLRTMIALHFNTNFDDLSIVDLVPFADVRDRLKKAEIFVSQGDFDGAIEETSISRYVLFSKLDRYLPTVSRSIRDADKQITDALEPARSLTAGPSLRGRLRAFGEIADYMEQMREMTLLTALNFSLDDYQFLDSTLCRVFQTQGGTWIRSAPHNSTNQGDATVCARQIACLVEMSVRIQEHIPK